jgi:hypothetical protein
MVHNKELTPLFMKPSSSLYHHKKPGDKKQQGPREFPEALPETVTMYRPSVV